MKKRIQVFVPKPTDGTSLYRGIGPISHLMRSYPDDIQFVFRDNVDWSAMWMVDGLFLQRPYKDDHVMMCEIAECNRKKIWVDYDDDLFTVPASNPAHDVYSKAKHQRNVAKIIAMADEVSVSTAYLKKKYDVIRKEAGKKECWHIPNAINEIEIPIPNQFVKRNPLMLWRGSATHHEDIYMHMGRD
jgi:hypothetical protein